MNIFKKYWLTIPGILVGSIAGYLYYHYVGCQGSCMIASSPVNSILYGALMGGIGFNSFQKDKTGKEPGQE
jgi:hypothetical protein